MVINKITWQKAGRVAQPGRYMFTFGWLTITAEDLRIWEQFPDAAFTLVQLPKVSEGDPQDNLNGQVNLNGQDNLNRDDVSDEFHLGAFEIPLANSQAAPHGSHGEA